MSDKTSLSDKILSGKDFVDDGEYVIPTDDIIATNKKILEKLLGYQYHSNPVLNEYCLNHIKRTFKSEMGSDLI